MEEPTTSPPLDEVTDASKESEKALSYRYWTGKPGDGVEAPAPRPVPKKLSQEELAQAAQSVLGSSGSAWNKAGTWEEKNLTGWGKDRVKELMKELEEVSFPGGSARVTEVTSCSGDEQDVSGTLKIPEAAYGELDEVTVETTFDSIKDLSADSKASIRKAFGGLVPFIVQRLSVFEEELKER